jgi:hypothetical protein
MKIAYSQEQQNNEVEEVWCRNNDVYKLKLAWFLKSQHFYEVQLLQDHRWLTTPVAENSILSFWSKYCRGYWQGRAHFKFYSD